MWKITANGRHGGPARAGRWPSSTGVKHAGRAGVAVDKNGAAVAVLVDDELPSIIPGKAADEWATYSAEQNEEDARSVRQAGGKIDRSA